MTLYEIVIDDIRKYRDDAQAEMSYFEVQRSPYSAIRKGTPL
jgi:hypothetical protein